jgi:nitrate reductase NapE component
MDEPPLKLTLEMPSETDPHLAGLEQLAWLMDRAFTIPGTRIKVGLDALLGLVPIGGDALTGIIQAGIVLIAVHHYRVPKPIAARMAGNVLLDTLVGSIPFVGDVFDIAFKANTRNIALLKRVRDQRAIGRNVEVASSIAWLALIAFVLLGTLSLVVIGGISVVLWLFQRPVV